MCCLNRDTTRPDSDVPQWAKEASAEIANGGLGFDTPEVRELTAGIIARHARQAKEDDRG